MSKFTCEMAQLLDRRIRCCRNGTDAGWGEPRSLENYLYSVRRRIADLAPLVKEMETKGHMWNDHDCCQLREEYYQLSGLVEQAEALLKELWGERKKTEIVRFHKLQVNDLFRFVDNRWKLYVYNGNGWYGGAAGYDGGPWHLDNNPDVVRCGRAED